VSLPAYGVRTTCLPTSRGGTRPEQSFIQSSCNQLLVFLSCGLLHDCITLAYGNYLDRLWKERSWPGGTEEKKGIVKRTDIAMEIRIYLPYSVQKCYHAGSLFAVM
jgi:hypothetical protein